jgi:hypothetical protein
MYLPQQRIIAIHHFLARRGKQRCDQQSAETFAAVDDTSDSQD